MSPSIKFFAKIAAVLSVFLCAWFWLANYLPAESDSDQLSESKALYLTGKFGTYDFDTGRLSQGFEGRSLSIKRLISFFYAIHPQGVKELMWFRLIPLFFTLLTFVLIVVYGFFRLRLSFNSLIYMSVFFLAQSMIVEAALYVRYYPALLFCMVAALICYWEGKHFFLEGRKTTSIILFLIGAALLGITIIDHWQLEHIPLMVLAIILSSRKVFDGVVQFLYVGKRRLVLIILCLLLFCPFIVIVLDELLSYLIFGNYLMGVIFVTYWDNMMGLLRSAIALGPCLIGMFIAVLKGKDRINFGIGWWLYFTGILTVIFLGLLANHNYIFYSRYFYLPVSLTIIGFAFAFEEVIRSAALKKTVLIVYLLANIFLSFIVFYFERNNMDQAISWLKDNIKEEDLVITYGPILELNGGKWLEDRAYNIANMDNCHGCVNMLNNFLDGKKDQNIILAKAASNNNELERTIELAAFLNQHPNGKIYYLFSNGGEFRENLYKWTTGEDRTIPDQLIYYLDERIPHENPFHHLHGVGLDLLDHKALVNGLNELIKKGFPKRDRPLSIHKRFLKAFFRLFHLPDKREDIRKLEFIKKIEFTRGMNM